MILALVGVIALGFGGWFFRDSLLPKAQTGGIAGVAVPWKPPGYGFKDLPLFKRPDFLMLMRFGDVPVKVLQEEPTDPFKEL